MWKLNKQFRFANRFFALNSTKFHFLKKNNFAGKVAPEQKLPVLDGKATDKKGVPQVETQSVQPWVEIENKLSKLKSELVLSDNDKIEKYVLNVVKGYFRTTYKDGITLESELEDHGLDSLDSVELGMILEDELGYIIEAETLPQFTKVKHFSNYIKQMEAYKKEHLTLPQFKAHEYEEKVGDWIPGGEQLRNLLKKMTKMASSKGKKQEKKAKAKH